MLLNTTSLSIRSAREFFGLCRKVIGRAFLPDIDCIIVVLTDFLQENAFAFYSLHSTKVLLRKKGSFWPLSKEEQDSTWRTMYSTRQCQSTPVQSPVAMPHPTFHCSCRLLRMLRCLSHVLVLILNLQYKSRQQKQNSEC